MVFVAFLGIPDKILLNVGVMQLGAYRLRAIKPSNMFVL